MLRSSVLLALLVAGCVEGVATPSDLEQSGAAPLSEVAQAEFALGWTAAIGSHSFLGDTVIGLKSSSACPAASFVVPAGTAGLTLTVGAGSGIGPYSVLTGSPGELVITHVVVPADVVREEAEPTPGIWRVEVKPQGATAMQEWPVVIRFETGAADDIIWQHDTDCLP